MKNQNEIDEYLDKMIEKAENDIEIVFAKRLQAIKAHIASMYQKYSEGGSISRTELYKYNRFAKEMKFIEENINEHYKQLYKDIKKLLQEQYVENLLRSGYIYEFEAQNKMDYVIPSLTTINQAILNPIKELTLSALLNNHRNEIIRKINIEIGQGLQNGESYREMARRIEKALGFSRTKAQRVARTEAGRVQTLSRMDSAEIASKYAELEKAWNSALDKDVRSSHRKLDGQKADEEGYFHYRGAKAKGPHLWGIASMDINCRCALIYLVDGKFPEVRRARLDDGKTVVIPYQPYEEWRKNLQAA